MNPIKSDVELRDTAPSIFIESSLTVLGFLLLLIFLA